VVVNPPYGERLELNSALGRDIGQGLRNLRGYRAAVLTASPELARSMKLKAEKSLILFNGAIECRLMTFDIRS